MARSLGDFAGIAPPRGDKPRDSSRGQKCVAEYIRRPKWVKPTPAAGTTGRESPQVTASPPVLCRLRSLGARVQHRNGGPPGTKSLKSHPDDCRQILRDATCPPIPYGCYKPSAGFASNRQSP